MPHSKLPASADDRDVGFGFRQLDTVELMTVLNAAKIEGSTRILREYLAAKIYAGMVGVSVHSSALELSPNDPQLKSKIGQRTRLVTSVDASILL